ncbi:MAG: hypothetical protein JWP13_9 [Candidatus Saccharibacteria bacterium]|nr:hypothetical protein [Candidatus Saccharibacteria bacterium]
MSGKLLSVLGYITVAAGLFFSASYFSIIGNGCAAGQQGAGQASIFFGITQLGISLATLAAVWGLRNHPRLRYEIATFLLIAVVLTIQFLAIAGMGVMAGTDCSV